MISCGGRVWRTFAKGDWPKNDAEAESHVSGEKNDRIPLFLNFPPNRLFPIDTLEDEEDPQLECSSPDHSSSRCCAMCHGGLPRLQTFSH